MERDYEFNTDILRFDKFAIHCMKSRGHIPSPMQLDAIQFLTWGNNSEAEYMNANLDDRRSMGNELCLLALRGWFKTTLMAMYCCWWIYTNPHVNIGYISNSTNTIQALMRDVKNLIDTVPELSPFRDTHNQDKNTNATQTKFRTKYAQPKEQTLWTAPLKGSTTGLRSKVMILDDIEIRDNSNTPEKLADIWSRVLEYKRLVDSGSKQQLIMVGTPWVTESTYYRACSPIELGGLGFKGRAYTARYPKFDEVNDYKGILAPFILDAMIKDPSLVGQVTDPSRINENLLVAQALGDKVEYYMNYMMNPFAKGTEDYSFSLEDIGLIRYRSLDNYPPPFQVDTQPHTRKPELIPFAPNKEALHLITPNLQSTSAYRAIKRILYIDPSAGGSDETAYCVLAMVNGCYVLERVGGYVDGASESTLDALIDVYNSYKLDNGTNCITAVIIEKNYGGGIYRKLFDARAEYLKCPIPTYDHIVVGNKFQRIQDTLYPVIKSRKFFITEECIEKDLVHYNDSTLSLSERNILKLYTFCYQLTHFYWSKSMSKTASPFGATGHDDRLDAVSSAVFFLNTLISPVADDKLEQKKFEDEQNYIRIRNIFGDKIAYMYYHPTVYPHLAHLHKKKYVPDGNGGWKEYESPARGRFVGTPVYDV